MAVSYTHLDVYKRQEHGLSGAEGGQQRRGQRPDEKSPVGGENYRKNGKSDSKAPEDVYKRQGIVIGHHVFW